MTNEEKDKNQQLFNEFIREFKKIKSNPIYFMEHYYNKLFPEKVVLMDDEEKQELYDEFKGIPYFEDMSKVGPYQKRIDELKAQGYKDWEIH